MVVWIVRKSRRALHHWSRSVVLYPVLALAVLAAVGGGYEKVSEVRDASVMTGRLIDVDDHKMRISCTGSGSPTVVLEPGLGESGAMMAGWIQPAVATSTRVCVYDRPGRGWSESPAHPQDAVANAADLHTLLARADVDGPYVLVGHSSGGAYIKVYAAQYPDQVAGMVLLDAQPSEAMTGCPTTPRLRRTSQGNGARAVAGADGCDAPLLHDRRGRSPSSSSRRGAAGWSTAEPVPKPA